MKEVNNRRVCEQSAMKQVNNRLSLVYEQPAMKQVNNRRVCEQPAIKWVNKKQPAMKKKMKDVFKNNLH